MTNLEESIATLNKHHFDMKKLYDNSYLKGTLDVLEDNLDDLSKWAVWNEDQFLDEIHIVENAFKELKAKMKKDILT